MSTVGARIVFCLVGMAASLAFAAPVPTPAPAGLGPMGHDGGGHYYRSYTSEDACQIAGWTKSAADGRADQWCCHGADLYLMY
ncbi:hypothetical protein [Kitasatospora sp. McL0602]|uniref:hypothetical protein n=1 Tax=Kitasatospora sp. McL0602 TaxID=3439530 RepID=UPI003F88D680